MGAEAQAAGAAPPPPASALAPQVHQADVSLHPGGRAQHCATPLPQTLEQDLHGALGDKGWGSGVATASTPPRGPLGLTFLFFGAGSPNRKWAASEGSEGDGVAGEDWSLAGSQPQSPPLLQLPSGRTRASFQGSRPGSVGTHQHPSGLLGGSARSAETAATGPLALGVHLLTGELGGKSLVEEAVARRREHTAGRDNQTQPAWGCLAGQVEMEGSQRPTDQGHCGFGLSERH